MKEKEFYVAAELEVVGFESTDVITTSGYGSNIDKEGWT